MAKSTSKNKGELLLEYNLKELLTGGLRGGYAKSYHSATNLVALAPEVKNGFPDGETVNTRASAERRRA